MILLGELHEKFKRGFQSRIPRVSPAHWRAGCIWLRCSETVTAVNQSASPPCLQRKLASFQMPFSLLNTAVLENNWKKCIHAYLPVKPGFLWVCSFSQSVQSQCWLPFLSLRWAQNRTPSGHAFWSARPLPWGITAVQKEKEKYYFSNLISSQWFFK